MKREKRKSIGDEETNNMDEERKRKTEQAWKRVRKGANDWLVGAEREREREINRQEWTGGKERMGEREWV